MPRKCVAQFPSRASGARSGSSPGPPCFVGTPHASPSGQLSNATTRASRRPNPAADRPSLPGTRGRASPGVASMLRCLLADPRPQREDFSVLKMAQQRPAAPFNPPPSHPIPIRILPHLISPHLLPRTKTSQPSARPSQPGFDHPVASCPWFQVAFLCQACPGINAPNPLLIARFRHRASRLAST